MIKVDLDKTHLFCVIKLCVDDSLDLIKWRDGLRFGDFIVFSSYCIMFCWGCNFFNIFVINNDDSIFLLLIMMILCWGCNIFLVIDNDDSIFLLLMMMILCWGCNFFYIFVIDDDDTMIAMVESVLVVEVLIL